MTKLFKKKEPADSHMGRITFKVTPKQNEDIRRAASIRQMDLSEFIRCAALGRKADVDFETEIVLALSELTRCVRMIHAALVDEGLNPGEEVWLPVIQEARAAMLRISK